MPQQTASSSERGIHRVPVSALPVLARTNTQAKRGPGSKPQLQLEQTRQLPRAQQRFVEKMLETVIAQAERS
ncbi:MAG: hypothetical protein IT383_06825 [Deltaproteobacteria bacterium]|nr:hypothetical protein [Deltaproteobacteria bacterium]